MDIKPGDRVRISIPGGNGIFDSFGAGWGEGVVLSANNYSHHCSGEDNWYIELEKDKVEGRNWSTGYGYWKQGQDGGTIEKLS